MRLPSTIAALVVSAFVWAASAAGPASPARSATRVGAASEVGLPYFQVFDERDGLPQSSISAIAFDTKGYLWIATQDGAAYYNGRVWTVVHMPNRAASNYLDSVASAPDGSVWFGSEGGGVLRLKDDAWTVYDAASGLPSGVVLRMCVCAEPDGSYSVVAATDRGLHRLKDGVWESLARGTPLADEYVVGLLETKAADGSSVLWAGGASRLGRLERGVWTFYDETSGLPAPAVRALAEGTAADGSRVIWAGTDKGLAWFDGTRWTRVDPAPGLPNVPIRCVAETVSVDGGRDLWVGTNGGGLARRSHDHWVAFTRETGLPNNQVDSLLQTIAPDGTRTLWAGTNGGGLLALREGGWLAFGRRTGIPDDEALTVCETVKADGTTVQWFGTSDFGLARLENGRVTVIDESAGLPSNRVKSLLAWPSRDGSETLWVGTRAGLAFVRDGRVAEVYGDGSGLPGTEILSFATTPAADGSETLWVGTSSGLARLADGRWTSFRVEPGKLPNGRVQSLLGATGDDGEPVLWVGTNGGLVRLVESGGEQWTVFDTSSGLANNVVLSILETKTAGRRLLWVGTFAGLSIVDLGGGGRVWKSLSDATVPALPNNNIFRLHEDAAGRVYASTTKGIVRLTPRTPTSEDPADFSVFTFTAADGLPGGEYNIGSSMRDSKGRIWFGGTKGVAMLDPALETADVTPKPLYVERTRVRYGGDAEHRLAPGESLAYDATDLVFEYALLSYHRAADTRYRTQLVGLNERPSDWTADAKREYPSLPEGDYEFRVWGRDYAGNVTGPVTIGFSVRPAPWRSWWAYGLYFASVVGLGYSVARLRVRTLKRRNQMLEAKVGARTAELDEKVSQLEVSERKAHESEQRAVEANRAKSAFLANMSHELRTPLNAILGFVQLMERDNRLEGDQRDNLGIIARSGEHLLGLINDILSLSKIEAGQLSLHENTFNLPRLLRGLEEMFVARAQTKRLQLLFETDPGIPVYVHGDEGKLRQVLINLLGNALKFTDSGGVAMRARWADGVCAFEVEDTGYGISSDEVEKLFRAFEQTESGQMAEEGTGLGLAISRNFVQLMGGDITVRSEPGRGTTFAFHVRLPAAATTEALRHERRVIGVVGAEDGECDIRVLVVDDKRENCDLLAKLLRTVGFAVREAANGAEAVEVWDVWRPHLIWMDIRMPVMDGYEATRRIRSAEVASGPWPVARSSEDDAYGTQVSSEHGPRATGHGPPCKIIALTASAFEHDREAVIAAGCDDFLAKPFRESSVFDKMAEHLGVQFRFEEPEAPGARRTGEPTSVTASLAALPPEFRSQLNDAVVQGDIGLAYGLIDGIRGRDEALAEELKGMLREYRFDDLLELIEKT